jgi:hypothetical protein
MAAHLTFEKTYFDLELHKAEGEQGFIVRLCVG